MPSFQINDDEFAALADEPADVFKLYCVIRRWMDYRTGVSGAVRRLSEQMFREELYIAPTRGRHESGSPTRQKVRSLVDRLISIGAITPIGPLVYQLPHADWDGASKRSATDEQPHQQPHQQPAEKSSQPNNNGAFSDAESVSATTSGTADTLISNLPPISVNTYTAHIAPAKFAMTDAWEPDPATFAGVLFRNGMAGQTFHADQLLEFRSYWISNPDRYRTQAQWEHALAQQLKRQSRIQQAEGTRHETGGRTPGRSTRNAHDILTDPNW
ncbi:DnaT-like ssDNA-binding domain-containing protein [Pseudomonas soli]|uniref:DnaT DNA-binding domain-containing protein n=1 Tax=Pseudomonas soli TaxID=1306993 RepID=A0AAJ5MII3_9PSED|nr:DnaT-like ssDNA-binding domain-containing protein [Pseudomonas soli]UXZ44516.1 hypothetical protein K7K07_20945 [Pseudomonas soli]